MSEEYVAPPTEEQRQQEAVDKVAAYKDSFQEKAGDNKEVINEPENDNSAVPERPEWVPEKFYNAETGEVDYEAFGKSHKELERQFHESRQKTPKEGDESAEDGESDEAGDQKVPAGLMEQPSVKAAQEAFAADGKLSDEHYAELEKDGIPREMVDAYVAGQIANSTAITNAAYEAAGGEEQYAAMQQWAAENLTEGQKKAFNLQLDTGDAEVIAAATENLFARYKENANIDADRVGGGAPSNDSSTFGSRQEMAAAMNVMTDDGRRRYDVDPAYRESIIRKIGNTRRQTGSV